MSGPAVTAVIPNLNSGPVLDRCLDALEQASGVAEVLVLDAGSDDGSQERARKRPGVRVLDLPGTSIQERLNRGVREAATEVSLPLNSDAFVDPDTPRLLAERMAADPSLGACGAALRYEDGSPQKSGNRYKTLARLTMKALRLPTRDHSVPQGSPPAAGMTEVTWIPYCAAALRREAFEEVGGFDDDYGFYFEDVDFSRALVEAGWKLAVCWEATAIHLGGGTTSARDPSGWYIRYHENALLYLRKWYPRSWRLFAVAWALRAGASSLLWRLRGLGRRLRRDDQGAASADEWARTFASTMRS